MPTYEERSRLIKALSEQKYFDALKDKEPSGDVRIGDRIGDTGRYQVLGADGGVTSNGVKTFNASLPSDGFVRGTKGGNAIALDHRNVKRAEPKRRVEEVAKTIDTIFVFVTGDDISTRKYFVSGDKAELTEVLTELPDGFVVDASSISIRIIDTDYEISCYSIKKRTVRFSKFSSSGETAFYQAENIIPETGDRLVIYYPNGDLKAVETNRGEIVYLGGGGGYIVFALSDEFKAQNYAPNFIESGYTRSRVTFTVGFVDLNEDTQNLSFSQATATLTEVLLQDKQVENKSADINIPLRLNRNVTVSIEIAQGRNSPIGNSPAFAFGNGTYCFLVDQNNYEVVSMARGVSGTQAREESIIVYNGTKFQALPISFLNYSSFLDPPYKPERYFLRNISNVFSPPLLQISTDLSFLVGLDLSVNSVLRYLKRTLNDGFGEIQEVEVLLAPELTEETTANGYKFYALLAACFDTVSS